MRLRNVLILCLITLAPMPSLAQQHASEGAGIIALEKKWTAAYRRRDISILSSLLMDDFVITVEDGKTYGKEGYISHTADTSVHVQVAEMSDLKVRMHGNTAVVTGAYYEKGESKGKNYEYRDRLTDVWMKMDNTWRVVASHYSVPLSD